jgi:hypothetical protein
MQMGGRVLYNLIGTLLVVKIPRLPCAKAQAMTRVLAKE